MDACCHASGTAWTVLAIPVGVKALHPWRVVVLPSFTYIWSIAGVVHDEARGSYVVLQDWTCIIYA